MRAALTDGAPWTTVAQSHGGFCTFTHLSLAPHGLLRCLAWDHGPVVGALWFDANHPQLADTGDDDGQLDEAALNTIGYVLSLCGRLSGRDLETLTHHEGPWLDADAEREPGTSVRIDTAQLRPHFREAARAGDDSDEIPPDSDVIQAFLERSAAGPSAGVTDSREALERLRTGV